MDARPKVSLVLGAMSVVILIVSVATDRRDLVVDYRERWESNECPFGRNFWIGCDLCKCNPGGLRICAGSQCPGATECPPIPKGTRWLRGACGERCACERGTRIIHCQRYCPITDGYHFYPHAQWD